MKTYKASSIALLLLALTGCATTSGKGDPRDPFEGYNRSVYKFNDSIDRAVLKPVAKGYDKAVPDLVKTGVRNFFGNLKEVLTLVNDLLQGKGEEALTTTGRFLLNTTFGMGGIFDIATPAGMTRNEEDFGQTLGRWGVSSGPYFIIPFLGSSTVRDALMRPLDSQFQYTTRMDDVAWRNSLYALEIIDTRASLLGASNVLGEAALDPYVFVRDAYLQRRQRMVYDGNPPDDENEDEFMDEEEGGKKEVVKPKEKTSSEGSSVQKQSQTNAEPTSNNSSEGSNVSTESTSN